MTAILALGVGIGLALPGWRIETITFEAGGRTWRLADSPPRRLPATLDIEDDGRLRLRVINRDSTGHSAGVLAVAASDSAEVPAEFCTGTHAAGATTLLLR